MLTVGALVGTCLLGFLAYLRGRSLACAGQTKRGYAWMSAAVLVGTGLLSLPFELP